MDEDVDHVEEMAQPLPYRDGKVHVMSDKCSTCVFRPGNLMNLSPGRLKEMSDHVQETGIPFTCHQTLPYAETEHQEFYGGAALCAGAIEAHDPPLVVLAKAIGAIESVDPK